MMTLFNNNYQMLARNGLESFLYLLFLLVIISYTPAALAANVAIKSAHVGLTPDYTRITLESNVPFEYELSMLENPHRVVIDLNHVKQSPALSSLPEKIDAIDPFVQQIRIGQFKPHVVRLVLDLKSTVVPRAYTISPKGNFGHRLILDVFHPDKATKISSQHRVDDVHDSEKDVLEELIASLTKREAPEPAGNQSHQLSYPQTQPIPSPHQLNGHSAATKRKPQRTPPAKSLAPRILVIAIDPGHGGKDPGATGNHGTHEKDITLAIAKKLKARIDKEPNMRAVLTRTGDYFVSLQQRRINARRANADLFVSIHADAIPNKPHVHGSSVFTLSEHGATSTTASWLANKENSVDNDLMGGVDIAAKSKDIRELLLDLSLSATINDSVKLAEHVLKQLGNINHLHKRNVEQAGFAVLKSPDIPSILVETAFLSSPKDEQKLRTKDYQTKMADAVFHGIKNYFSDNPALTRADMAHSK